MHQTVGSNVLCTLVHVNPPATAQQAWQLVKNTFATAMHATHSCGVSQSLGISPRALIYKCDMFLDLPAVADQLTICQWRQVLINENIQWQNTKRQYFNYGVARGQVLIKTIPPNKLQPQAIGLFPILQVHTNGTLTVQGAPHATEQTNIRRVIPFCQWVSKILPGFSSNLMNGFPCFFYYGFSYFDPSCIQIIEGKGAKSGLLWLPDHESVPTLGCWLYIIQSW